MNELLGNANPVAGILTIGIGTHLVHGMRGYRSSSDEHFASVSQPFFFEHAGDC